MSEVTPIGSTFLLLYKIASVSNIVIFVGKFLAILLDPEIICVKPPKSKNKRGVEEKCDNKY